MDIAAIILTWNQSDLTEVAARSVATDVNKVHIVDNGFRHEELERLRAFAGANDITLVENGRNLGYGAGNNTAIARALQNGHEALLIMNNDAWAEPGAVELLAARLDEASGVGAVQPMVVTVAGDEVQHTTCSIDVRRGQLGWDDVGRLKSEVDRRTRPAGWLSGEAILARAEVFNQIGSFDERYFIYFEDVDWSLRVKRAGWELETVGAAVFRHAITASMPSVGAAFHFTRSRVLFLRFGLGMSRARAVRRSLPAELRRMISFARRGKFAQITKGSVPGLVSGFKRG